MARESLGGGGGWGGRDGEAGQGLQRKVLLSRLTRKYGPQCFGDIFLCSPQKKALKTGFVLKGNFWSQ